MASGERSAAPFALVIGCLAAPLVGLVLLLGFPSIDLLWEHDPSHFWLVMSAAVVNVVLGVVVSEAARQRDDVRTFLVAMVLLASAGFLALHALATPGVVLAGPNGGFNLATPVGLLLAAAFAAVSATEIDDRREATLRRRQRAIRRGLVSVLVVWAVWSVSGLPPLDRVFTTERAPWLLALLPFGVAAYVFAAGRYLAIYRSRERPLPLAVATAFVLLAEALIAVAFSRAWHVSWWEWHVLMTVAFAVVLLAARTEYRQERSLSRTFGGIYLERTLERLDRRQSGALADLARAHTRGGLDDATMDLRRQGFTSDELSMLVPSARELARMDGLLRRYVGPRLAERLGEQPDLADLGGTEREVSVLFADLVGFTSFAEGRPAHEVVDMLNTYWGAVVPIVVEREGGLIERFAGDAVLAVFNALGDQADHATRAARAALAIRDGSERVRSEAGGWPRFRVGVNTGPAVIGNVGAGHQQSFSVIGDTTNVAARLQAMSAPGHITIGARTRDAASSAGEIGLEVRPLGPTPLRGKRQAEEAFELLGVRAPEASG